jgi:hypothetical protein
MDAQASGLSAELLLTSYRGKTIVECFTHVVMRQKGKLSAWIKKIIMKYIIN